MRSEHTSRNRTVILLKFIRDHLEHAGIHFLGCRSFSLGSGHAGARTGEGGELFDRIVSKKYGFTEKVCAVVIKQMLLAANYLSAGSLERAGQGSPRGLGDNLKQGSGNTLFPAAW